MFNNIRHLRYVVGVARAGSLFKAAEELMVSESALSAVVKACEQEVGYDIFIRQPARPLTLTSAGSEFIRSAAVFLEQAEFFHQQSIGLGTTLKGDVRLGCFSALAGVMLPDVIRYCQEHFPHLHVLIAEYDLLELVKRLRSGEVDVAITYDLQYDNEIVFQPLFDVRPHIGVSVKHRLADRDSVSLREIADEPMVLIDYPVTKQHILRLLLDQGITPNVAHYPKTIETLHSFVANGFGYSVFFLDPHDEIHTPSYIHRLEIEDDVPSHRLVVAYPKQVRLTARIRAVVEACQRVYSNREHERGKMAAAADLGSVLDKALERTAD